MSTFGMLVRLIVSLSVLGLIAWQAPAMIGIVLFLAVLAIQAAVFMRAYRALETMTGRSFDRAARRLVIEVVAGVVTNAAVWFGSMWAASVYG